MSVNAPFRIMSNQTILEHIWLVFSSALHSVICIESIEVKFLLRMIQMAEYGKICDTLIPHCCQKNQVRQPSHLFIAIQSVTYHLLDCFLKELEITSRKHSDSKFVKQTCHGRKRNCQMENSTRFSNNKMNKVFLTIGTSIIQAR